MMDLLLPVAGLAIGIVIGLAFGSIQSAALLRHKNTQQRGGLGSGWVLMPGSMRRVAFLLIALAVVQITCPLLFEGNTTQWFVSGGVVLGYGWTLFRQIRQHSIFHA